MPPGFEIPAIWFRQIISRQVVGVPGFEPGTLRLSSACSNQLSYTPRAPAREFQISNLRFEIQSWWS
jgi:hypothetical protein